MRRGWDEGGHLPESSAVVWRCRREIREHAWAWAEKEAESQPSQVSGL